MISYYIRAAIGSRWIKIQARCLNMTWKRYLKSLESISKKLFEKEKLFDIILYGSAVKGKDEPRDIDIVIIFFDEEVRKRLDIAQEFKKYLPKELKLDIQTLN